MRMIRTGMRGLGNTGCPTGQTMKVTYGGVVGSTAPLYECVDALEESIWCQWFGMGCKTPAAYTPAPAAPSTETQMTVPGAWTPELSAQMTYEEYQAMLAAYNNQNPDGVASLAAALSQAGDSISSVVSSKTTWIILGAIGAVAGYIALKK